MTFGVVYRARLANGYDPVLGSKLLGWRIAAHRGTHSANGRTAAIRQPNSREAA